MAGRVCLPRVRWAVGVGDQAKSPGLRLLRLSGLADGGDHLPGHPETTAGVVPGNLVGNDAKERGQCAGVAADLGFGQLRDCLDVAAQAPPGDGAAGRDQLSSRVEVDEAYVGGLEEGVSGRQTETKALIAVACEEDGPGIGRIRLRRIRDASAASLHAFIEEAIKPGSAVHTDGWEGYAGLESKGYSHKVTVLRGRKRPPSQLMPRVHRVASLLKRWLLGTHQGAVSLEHLDYYLDEFTFRFNRRTSRSRGKLFYRLLQQAVAVAATPYKTIVQANALTTTYSGYWS